MELIEFFDWMSISLYGYRWKWLVLCYVCEWVDECLIFVLKRLNGWFEIWFGEWIVLYVFLIMFRVFDNKDFLVKVC